MAKDFITNNLTRSMSCATNGLSGHEQDAIASANTPPCEPNLARFPAATQEIKPKQTHWAKLAYYQQDGLKMPKTNPSDISPMLSAVYSDFLPRFPRNLDAA
jgi:hypothetical protein